MTVSGEGTRRDEQIAANLRDVRSLLEQIVKHEGHHAVEHCVPAMIETARAAIVLLDKEIDSDA